jgi:RNA polymerase sigma-70 factor (ECF subfamily)
MVETSWAVLRGLLVDSYEEFRSRLTRRLGSEDLANESLHETWLRLHRSGHAGAVRSPRAFLLRIALNIAHDHMRVENRCARPTETLEALAIADASLDPARRIEAGFALKAVERAILELPERSRSIFLASRLEGLTHQAIAQRLGISKRTVQYELERTARALEVLLDENEPQKK